MSATIVQTNVLSVQSPYNRDFALAARNAGGYWRRDAKVWEFNLGALDRVRALCETFYGSATVTDAFPEPVVPEAQPDFGYYGKVGDVVTVSLEIVKVIDFNGSYGPTRLHLMKDAEGRVFTWYASSARYEPGTSVRLQGKIKAQNPYKGVSQTVLTRCKKV